MPNHQITTPSRRQMLTYMGAGAAALLGEKGAQAAELPLNTSGLEHIGMMVPDQEAAAKFYDYAIDKRTIESGRKASGNQ